MNEKRSPKHLKQEPAKPSRKKTAPARPDPANQARKPTRYGVYFIIIAVVLVIAAVLISWDKFTVREIEVDGLEKVSYLEVVHLSGIEYMSNIFSIDLKDVEESIEQNPILDVIDSKRKLPDTIEITVAERHPAAEIRAGDNYVVVSSGLIALGAHEASAAPGSAEVIGTQAESYVLGQEVTLLKEIHSRKLKQLLAALEETGTSELIKTIDISFTENIKLFSGAGYEIQIGSTDNIENKCLWIKTMIPKLLEEGRQGGTLFITNVNTAHYIAPNGTENE
jgi:cell division protein FtsQ